MTLKILLADDGTGARTLSPNQLLSTATASSGMLRDANANTQINNINEAFNTTATAAGTTTLLVSSPPLQQFTGTTTQTVVLPNATTLVVGTQYVVFNRSTGVVTVQANGGGTLQAMSGSTQCIFTLANAGTSAGTWDISYTGAPTAGVSYRSGQSSIGSGVTSLGVTFSSALSAATYGLNCNLLNTTDSNPQFQPITITAISTTGFTASWNAPTDSANYILVWTAIAAA